MPRSTLIRLVCLVLAGALAIVAIVLKDARDRQLILQAENSARAAENRSALLERQIAQLKRDEAARISSAARSATQARPAGEPRRWDNGQGHPLAAGLTAVSKLKNAGRATPRDAFATQLWASSVGDIDAAASAITFTDAGRKMLLDALKEVPPDLAAEYNTPEKLMAYALAGSPHPVGGMSVDAETPGDTANTMMLQVSWQHADDDIVHQNNLLFQQDASGQWQQVMPNALVRRAVAYLTSR